MRRLHLLRPLRPWVSLCLDLLGDHGSVSASSAPAAALLSLSPLPSSLPPSPSLPRPLLLSLGAAPTQQLQVAALVPRLARSGAFSPRLTPPCSLAKRDTCLKL